MKTKTRTFDLEYIAQLHRDMRYMTFLAAEFRLKVSLLWNPVKDCFVIKDASGASDYENEFHTTKEGTDCLVELRSVMNMRKESTGGRILAGGDACSRCIARFNSGSTEACVEHS